LYKLSRNFDDRTLYAQYFQLTQPSVDFIIRYFNILSIPKKILQYIFSVFLIALFRYSSDIIDLNNFNSSSVTILILITRGNIIPHLLNLFQKLIIS